MCGRFFVGGDFRDKMNELMIRAGIAAPEMPYPAPGGDVFPSNQSVVIFGEKGRLLSAGMSWGYANPYRKGLIINARAETAGEKNVFAEDLRARRCVIPASGFYEWDRARARYRFTRPDGGLLLMAGLWRQEDGRPHYTILTTAANESMAPVHDRMPAMIEHDELKAWITDDKRTSDFLLRPQPEIFRELESGQLSMDFGL